MFVLRVITAKCVIDVTLYSMKNKSVHRCRFVHHAKFHSIMAMLNKLFKFEFERAGGGLQKSRFL